MAGVLLKILWRYLVVLLLTGICAYYSIFTMEKQEKCHRYFIRNIKQLNIVNDQKVFLLPAVKKENACGHYIVIICRRAKTQESKAMKQLKEAMALAGYKYNQAVSQAERAIQG